MRNSSLLRWGRDRAALRGSFAGNVPDPAQAPPEVIKTCGGAPGPRGVSGVYSYFPRRTRPGGNGQAGPSHCTGVRPSGRHGPRVALAPNEVIPGYTQGMKTAISVPDEIFEQAAGQAAELGISRSEFFARAARSYLDELAAQSLTSQIDQALQAAGDDDSGAEAVAAGRRLLATGDDDW